MQDISNLRLYYATKVIVKTTLMFKIRNNLYKSD